MLDTIGMKTEDRMTYPNHVAVIMDGNGRWARMKGLSRKDGHKAGARVATDIIHYAIDSGVQVLTLFAFSTENWERPVSEVGTIMSILQAYLNTEIFAFLQRGVRFRVIGEREQLGQPIQFLIDRAEKLSAGNEGLQLNLALSYGSKNELIRAVKKIAVSGFDLSLLNEEVIEANLDTAGLPPVDLLIRTSGEQRLSNFLLWQCAYSEFYFTEVMWPDFTREIFSEALQVFLRRSRRFGKIEEEIL